MIYAAFNKDGELKHHFTIANLAFMLGHKINLVNRKIIFDNIPTITIGESYSNEEVPTQMDEIVRMLLSNRGYKIYKLIAVDKPVTF